MTNSTILCMGELLLRLTSPRQELLLQSSELRAGFAGAEANVAVALSSFGHVTKLLTVLPENHLGDSAIAELRKHGVDTSAIARSSGRLGLFYVTPGAVLRPAEVEYDRKDSAFALGPVLTNATAHIPGAQWFHVSGITPALGSACAEATLAAVKAARQAGLQVSFDGNYRSKLWQGREAEAPAILRSILEHATTFFGDERDIALVLGQSIGVRQHAMELAFKAFPALQSIACTTRAQVSASEQTYGAQLFTRHKQFEVTPVHLSGIVDRLGTGDVFAAGIIHSLISQTPLQAALAFAHAAACLKHSIPGDFFPCSARTVSEALTNSTLDVKR